MKLESEATTLRGERDILRLVTVVIACFPFAGVDTSLPQQYHQTGEMAKFWGSSHGMRNELTSRKLLAEEEKKGL
jgi:hypothetical protein